jgi:hypothetical protein
MSCVAEPLPDRHNRQMLLFFEAAEGGAGVLRRLVNDPQVLRRIAHKALEICHFDADGTDLHHAPHATEVCEAACYYCLLNYGNQHEHNILRPSQHPRCAIRLGASQRPNQPHRQQSCNPFRTSS